MPVKVIAMQGDLGAAGQPFAHHYSVCVGAGRACEGLRADWQAQLCRARRECGFEYVRFHGLLTDDMHVCYRDESGALRYSWQYVDSLFDALLAMGVRPFVEFGFCPAVLAGGTRTQFWWQGRVDPPADLDAWADLVGAACRHWVARYGAEEVRRWYFEIWNEPDLNAFWNGTRSQYFALYAVSARAVKAADPALRVGGPATSNFVPDDRFDGEVEDTSRQLTAFAEDLDALDWHGVWIEEFLAYCAAHHLPVDFVSAHPYPTDWALDGHGNTCKRTRKRRSLEEDVEWLRQAVARSAYPRAELCLTEWSSSPSSRDCSHDELPAACYIADAALSVNENIRCLSYWTFTDIFEELGGGHLPFHGGFGLFNFNGIPKPAYHVYRMMHRLGDTLLHRTGDCIVTRKDGQLRAMAWNYSDAQPKAVPMCAFPDHEAAARVLADGTPALLTLDLRGLRPCQTVLVEQLDEAHGDAAALWRQMGAPENLTPDQTRALRQAAGATGRTVLRADDRGVLQAELSLPPWAVVLLQSL